MLSGWLVAVEPVLPLGELFWVEQRWLVWQRGLLVLMLVCKELACWESQSFHAKRWLVLCNATPCSSVYLILQVLRWRVSAELRAGFVFWWSSACHRLSDFVSWRWFAWHDGMTCRPVWASLPSWGRVMASVWPSQSTLATLSFCTNHRNKSDNSNPYSFKIFEKESFLS